ncbi:DNA polymerase-3 subunit epsilon [Cyclobacterium lianum]|uniref:DNA polymerase-3 subunit epsilon n=1 Tax=Cyclobacterium lianum TaxID=388280 RepID=A0A1M7HUG9_9BACT|nr:3'-5' exonuclease [Cyclobacterium lianum]SHM32125.1 DNA polymerase-3 subunit epsilon [Cyclobacterium lianum]
MDWRTFFGFATLPKPEYIRAYEKTLERRIASRKPVSELEFLVLDTETTGLDTKRDHVLSYGAVQVSHNRIKISSAKEYYLRPKKRNREAIKVHGLVRERPFVSREALIRSFLEDARHRVLVGHHLGFDLAMMERVGRSLGLRKIKSPALDTFDLAVRLDMGKYYDPRSIVSSEYSLDKLCERYNIVPDDRHTAAGDAFLAAQLLVKLLKQAEKKGIKTFGELMG